MSDIRRVWLVERLDDEGDWNLPSRSGYHFFKPSESKHEAEKQFEGFDDSAFFRATEWRRV